MKKDVKRKIAIIAVIVFLAACLSFNAACFDIDGKQSNYEWRNSEIYVLESPKGFNNDIVFAYIRVELARAENRLYICAGIEFQTINDPLLAGMKISVNNGALVTVMADNSNKYDSDKYYVQNAAGWDLNSKNMVIETALGIKAGVREENTLLVSLIDTNGQNSNTFEIDIKNEPQEPMSTYDSGVSNTKSIKSTTTKPASTKKAKDNDFTYKLAGESSTLASQNDIDEPSENLTQAGNNDQTPSGEVMIEDLTPQATNKKDSKRKIYVAIGSAGAVLIAIAAVASALKKNIKKTKDDNDKTDF